MIYVQTSWYPPDKQDEVVKTYFEAMEKYPPDESLGKLILPLGVRSTKDGIKVISIHEVTKGKYEEFANRIGQFMMMFSDIEGYRWESETFLSGEEAMSVIGKEMP